ncbi:hypothetical protein KM176_05495 [Pseudooceanicola sp. CBS1P-1]|uniref:Uncharacterized protein n=1 Tax=Pseudooceanicola albus TaxID=2692189 RepID=A0A6L7FWZ2_9RHOB|nr:MULTISPECIES: hypothetical protein [Pseudooceanicola]MBT9383306.1 hypothetical protein [Pseudooceanicola endophyticus]MXN16371.1 hypothetical protein [Pseudooceanicola albus]
MYWPKSTGIVHELDPSRADPGGDPLCGHHRLVALSAPLMLTALLRRHRPAKPPRPGLFPDIDLQVTFRRPDGVMITETVPVNGGNLLTDTATLARLALRDRRDRDCARILSVRLAHPAPTFPED